MVGNNALRDLNLASIRKIRCSGLEEEEGLLGYSVVQFLDVVDVVATDGHNLYRDQEIEFTGGPRSARTR